MAVIAGQQAPRRQSHRLQVTSRITAAVVGGWACTWGFVTLGIALLLKAGMVYADAQMLVYLLAFLVYLSLFLWCFAAASATRAWLVLVAASSGMTALAWWLVRQPA